MTYIISDVRQDRMGALAAPVSGRIYEGRVARVHPPGDPLRYAWGVEHRDAIELERIVAQLVGRKFVLLHPDASPANQYGMVERGAQCVEIGRIVGARLDDGHAVAQILVTDERGLEAIEGGVHELSLGYLARTDASGFQRNTQVDHLALVPRARCGATCALRVDCGCDSEPDKPDSEPTLRHEITADSDAVQGCGCKALANPLDLGQHANHMPQASDTETTAEPSMDELKTQLADASAKLDAANAALDATNAANDVATAQITELTARAEKAEQDLAAAVARADEAQVAAVNALKDLETAVLPEKTRADNAEAALQARNDEVTQALAAKDEAHTAALATLRTDHAAQLADAVSKKVALIIEAAPILGNTDLVKMSEREIKLAVIKHVDQDDYSDAKFDDSFVAGIYVGSVKRHGHVAVSRETVRTAVVAARADGAKDHKPATGLIAEKRSQDALRQRMSAQHINGTKTQDKD